MRHPTWGTVALAVLLVGTAVTEIAWKQGRGKSTDDAQARIQAKNDLRARITVDSIALARLKDADNALILAQQDVINRLATQMENLKCN